MLQSMGYKNENRVAKEKYGLKRAFQQVIRHKNLCKKGIQRVQEECKSGCKTIKLMMAQEEEEAESTFFVIPKFYQKQYQTVYNHTLIGLL